DLVSATSKANWHRDQSGEFFGGLATQGAIAGGLSEELRLTSTAADSFRWTGGLFYRKLDQSFDEFIQSFNFSLGGTNSSKSYAGFGEGTWVAFDKRLDVTLGMRYFSDDRKADQETNGVFVPAESATFHSFNPKLNLAYHVAKDWLLYTNVAKGFRSGEIQ